MGHKHYAVKVGRGAPVICDNWGEVQGRTRGFPGNVHRGERRTPRVSITIDADTHLASLWDPRRSSGVAFATGEKQHHRVHYEATTITFAPVFPLRGIID